jgi:oligoribonuclease
MTDGNKSLVPTKLLWVDLEMTGLDPTKDVILEVAAEVTDFNFKTLASYEACVRHPRELVEERMDQNNWWADYPKNRDAFIQKLDEAKPSDAIEQDLIKLIETQFGSEPAILAGNSIHNDRNFIKQWWPKLDAKLHYRMLDVTALKVLFQGKYTVEYDKPEVHRAYDDIRASIAELEFYLEWFRKNDHQS